MRLICIEDIKEWNDEFDNVTVIGSGVDIESMYRDNRRNQPRINSNASSDDVTQREVEVVPVEGIPEEDDNESGSGEGTQGDAGVHSDRGGNRGGDGEDVEGGVEDRPGGWIG